MYKHKTLAGIALVALTVALAACGQTAAPAVTPAPSIGVGAPPSASPDASASPTIDPSGSPTPTSAPSPTPAPAPRRARWATRPHRIFAGDCGSAVATIDGSGRFHVAADCDQRIRYASSSNGTTWKTSTIPTPKGRFDVGAQITVDGSTLYLVFTRLRPIDAGCGDDGLTTVGVFYRTRALPGGAWSSAKQIGRDGDALQAVRVVGGVIHATVASDDGMGPVFYTVKRGSTIDRIKVPGAGETSLRVGDDGRARIAYSTEHAIKYAIVQDDNRLTTSTVFSAADVVMSGPVLVLGGGDHAYVSWAAMEMSFGGCAEPEPPKTSHKGTWFATDVTGSWAAKRLTREVGSASLVVDVDSGRVHAIYADPFGLRYATRAASGKWFGSRLDPRIDIVPGSLRRDARNGHMLLVGPNADDSLKPGIYAVTAS